MADLKLDPTTGDLAIEGGDLAVVRGIDAVAQALRIRLRFFQGEWFLDTRKGLPYYQSILVKNPDLSAVEALYKQAILETPGVTSIKAFSSSFDATTRRLSITFTAATAEGDVTITEGTPV